MDHHFRVGARGTWEGDEDKYYFGGRPTGFYIPVSATGVTINATICADSATKELLLAAIGVVEYEKWVLAQISKIVLVDRELGTWA